MADKQFDNSGILFRNEDKNKDTDRDYRGNATIDGREFWVSGWIREAKNGSKFLKFSFKPEGRGGSGEAEADTRQQHERRSHILTAVAVMAIGDDFLPELFRGTEGPIYLCALRNNKKQTAIRRGRSYYHAQPR